MYHATSWQSLSIYHRLTINGSVRGTPVTQRVVYMHACMQLPCCGGYSTPVSTRLCNAIEANRTISYFMRATHSRTMSTTTAVLYVPAGTYSGIQKKQRYSRKTGKTHQ